LEACAKALGMGHIRDWVCNDITIAALTPVNLRAYTAVILQAPPPGPISV
jgi:hypothetical protein